MNKILEDLLSVMAGLAAENGEEFVLTRKCLESWRQALRVWHEDGTATAEEVEAFNEYIATLGE